MEDIFGDTRKENESVENMYSTLSEAKEEIQKRWNDKDLRRKVEKYLGEIPPAFQNEPVGALFRFIATPNLEFQIASEMARMANLDIVFMEFLGDKFCTRNLDKVHLGKMKFFKNINGKKIVIAKDKIIDIEKSESLSFHDMVTLKGMSFVNFHHDIFFNLYPNKKIFNASCFKMNGETASEVYDKVLALFVANGILFENYFINTNNDERRFVLDVIRPAFKRIEEMFGVKPLIVPLISNKIEGDILWQCYHYNLLEENNRI